MGLRVGQSLQQCDVIMLTSREHFLLWLEMGRRRRKELIWFCSHELKQSEIFQTLRYSKCYPRSQSHSCGCGFSPARLKQSQGEVVSLLQWRKPVLPNRVLCFPLIFWGALRLACILCLLKAAPQKSWPNVLERILQGDSSSSSEQLGTYQDFSSKWMQINIHFRINVTHCEFWIGRIQITEVCYAERSDLMIWLFLTLSAWSQHFRRDGEAEVYYLKVMSFMKDAESNCLGGHLSLSTSCTACKKWSPSHYYSNWIPTWVITL